MVWMINDDQMISGEECSLYFLIVLQLMKNLGKSNLPDLGSNSSPLDERQPHYLPI